MYVVLSRRSGGSPVRIVLNDAEPSLSDEWEDVVEASVTVPPGPRPRWCTWANEESGALEIDPGSYRVRVSSRGRDAGNDGEFAEGAVDWYLIELWPAPPRADAILRTSGAEADYWHREIGSRR